MQRKFYSIVSITLVVLTMYGTYLVSELSTVQYLYVAYPRRVPYSELAGSVSQSSEKEARSEESNYENFRKMYSERSKTHSNGEIHVQHYNNNEVHVTSNTEDRRNNIEIDLYGYNSKTTQTGDENMKTILWYDTHRQSMVGHSTKVNFVDCEYQKCRFKYIISPKDVKPTRPFDADAVLVQSKAMLTLSPPPRRDPNQVFVLAVRDAFPVSRQGVRNVIAQRWTNQINWTMTYRLDSDFIYKYANIVERQHVTGLDMRDPVVERETSVDLSNKDYERIFNEKSGDVVWFVSHCETKSHRENYVEELKKVINVKIYGKCGETPPCPKGSQSCFEELALKYKFYLAFENTLYEDYVTEKVYNWFNKDVIVVARGGSNYSRILPPGTVIDAGDFHSPTELGNYLKDLAHDKERYKSHLKRKDNYIRTSKLSPVREANCKLCEYLHSIEKHRKSYTNIYDWWLENWRN